MRVSARLGRIGERHQVVLKAVFWTTVAVVSFAAASFFLVGGSKREIAFALCIVLLPIAIYIAVIKPFIFPFGLYVALVPFDNVLRVGSFGTLTKLMGICSALAFAFWLVRNRRYVKPARATVIWLVLLAWMALSVMWSINSDDAIGHLITSASLIGLFVITALMPLTTSEFKALLTAVLLGSIAAAAYSIYQFHAGGSMVLQSQVGEQLTSRVFVQVGEDRINPNAFAAALLLPIALTTMAILQRRWSLSKLTYIGVLLILLGGVYASGSRGALLALGIMLAYLLLRSRYKAQVILFAFAMIVAGLFKAQSLWGRFANAVSTGGAGRLSIWAVGWDAFKHHWLAGAGVGNFVWAYDQSYIRIFQAYNAHWHRVSHNSFLTMGVELGIVGVAIGGLAWFYQWKALAFVTNTDRLYDLRIALESAVVALFAASLFLELMSDKYTWLVFEVIAATRAYALYTSQAGGGAFPLAPIHLQQNRPVQPGFRQKVPTNA